MNLEVVQVQIAALSIPIATVRKSPHGHSFQWTSSPITQTVGDILLHQIPHCAFFFKVPFRIFMISENYQNVKTPTVQDISTEKHDQVIEKKHDCSIAMMILLALPRLAIQMALAAQWAGIGPYLQTLLPSYAVQLTQLIGPTTGILVAPTVGALSDTCTSSWGRRRPFLFFGGMTTIICWALMAHTRDLGDWMGSTESEKNGWTAFFMIICYAWMDITINIVATPAKLLVADFAGSRQVTGAAIGQAATTLGCLLVAAYIELFGAPWKLHLKVFFVFLGVVMFIAVGTVCLFAKEVPLRKEDKTISSTANIAKAFASIWTGIKTLPSGLRIYALIFVMAKYGFTAYNGSKGQFFGLVVFNGVSEGADKCKDQCTDAQKAYSQGVKVASGRTDIIFNILGYFFAFAVPLLVHKFGSRRVLMFGLLPQSLLILLAVYHEFQVLNMMIVVSTAITVCIIYTLIVPIVLNEVKRAAKEKRALNEPVAVAVVMDDQMNKVATSTPKENAVEEDDNVCPNIGIYVGAINSANCLGQFLNFALSSALVTSSWGYSLPIFVGGIVTLGAIIVTAFCFKSNFYSY